MDHKKFPLISIIILNYNGKDLTENCIGSVLKSDYPSFEIIVVDNASTDDSLSIIEGRFGQDSRVSVIKNIYNLLYAAGNNAGIKQAKGEYIVVLNNDTEVDKNWLTEIFVVMKDDKIGAAQPKILILNRFPPTIDYAGAGVDKYGYALGYGRCEIDNGQFDDNRDIFYAGGTAMILKKNILDNVGLFDEKFGAHWEDVDLSWRIRLSGYKIVFIPRAIVYHIGSWSMKRFTKKNEVAYSVRKNRIAGLIKNYSFPNLFKVLPTLLIIYLFIFIKELIWDGNARIAQSSILAIFWNVKEFPYILKQRKIVQNKIRVVRDSEIIRFMEKNPLFIKED